MIFISWSSFTSLQSTVYGYFSFLPRRLIIANDRQRWIDLYISMVMRCYIGWSCTSPSKPYNQQRNLHRIERAIGPILRPCNYTQELEPAGRTWHRNLTSTELYMALQWASCKAPCQGEEWEEDKEVVERHQVVDMQAWSFAVLMKGSWKQADDWLSGSQQWCPNDLVA